jgi:hypothetical protein
MATTFRVIALSLLDIEGPDLRGEPELSYPEALTAAQELKAQGKAFRVVSSAECTDEQMEALKRLGPFETEIISASF